MKPLKLASKLQIFILYFLSQTVLAINYQQFSRSNALSYEKLDDARLENSHIHNKFDAIFTLGGSWVDAPLTVKNPANTSQLSHVIDDMYSLHMGAGFYVSPWLLIGGTTSYSIFKDNNGKNYSGLGDIELKAKARLFYNKNLGFSIMPLITVPTNGGQFRVQNTNSNMDGQEISALSDEGLGYGAKFIFEYLFKYFQVTTNIGYRFNSDARNVDSTGKTQVDMRTQLYTGIGTYIPLYNSWGINAEWIRLWSNPQFNNDINPNELFLGTSTGINQQLHAYAGVGLGNPFDDSDGNDIRLSAGIKYTPKLWSKKERAMLKDIPPNEAYIESKTCYVFDHSNKTTLYFPNDISSFDQATKDKFVDLVTKIQSKIDHIAKVRVVGHTSRSGSAEYNQILSEKRALGVKNYLVQQGIDEDLITSEGKGESEVLDENDLENGSNKAAAAKNRRTDFFIELKDECTTD